MQGVSHTGTQCGSSDYLAILQQPLSFKIFNIFFYKVHAKYLALYVSLTWYAYVFFAVDTPVF